MKPVGQHTAVDIGPSRLLGLYLSATHLVALLVALYLAQYHPFCFGLAIPLFWSWRRGWSLYAVQSSQAAVSAVEWRQDGSWTLVDKQQRRHSAKLIEPSFVASWMTLLSFSAESIFARRHVILLKDNSDLDQVRRLRVRLRLHG